MNIFCPTLVGGEFLPARSMNRAMPGGHDESPGLEWSDVPPQTRSFCLTITDIDAGSAPRVLWSLINIPYEIRLLPSNASYSTDLLPSECVQLTNTAGNQRYDGPTIVVDGQAHAIVIELFALSVQKLNIGLFTPADERLKAIRSKTLERTTLTVTATRTR